MNNQSKRRARTLWKPDQHLPPVARSEHVVRPRRDRGRPSSRPSLFLIRQFTPLHPGRRHPPLKSMPVAAAVGLLGSKQGEGRLLTRVGGRAVAWRVVRVGPLLDQEHEDEARDEGQSDRA